MKRMPALLLLLLVLGGCSVDPEDRDFYYHGWMHPKVENEDRQFYHNYLNDTGH